MELKDCAALRRIRRVLTAVALGGLCSNIIGSNVASAQSIPQSWAIILVDISQSFAPLTDADTTRALESIADSLHRLAVQEWDQPVMLWWSTIGAPSRSAKNPCGLAIQYRTKIVKGKNANELTSPDDLRAWFKACVLRLTGPGIQPEPHTDISGAISKAGQVLRKAQGRKVIILLSDFVESLPSGALPATFKLNSEHVVMVYRPEVKDEKNLNQMTKRLDEWETKIRQAGAKDVCQVPVGGISPASVEQCLKQVR